MNRSEKSSKIVELNESFQKAQFAVVADYRGLKVTELEKLRRDLRDNNAQIKVAKNTLLKLAVKGTDFEDLSDHFTGTTAVAFSSEDAVGSAKAIAEFAEEFEALSVRCGILDGEFITPEEVTALSKLPGKDQLRAQLLGLLNAVPTGLVRVLSAVPGKFVYALQAINDQKEN